MPADVRVRVTSCTVHPSASEASEAVPRFVPELLELAGTLQFLICVLVQAGLNAAALTLNLTDRIFSPVRRNSSRALLMNGRSSRSICAFSLASLLR